MLVPFLLSLTLAAAPPGPVYLPSPAETLSQPRIAEVAPVGRAAATLRLEVVDDLPSFPIPVGSSGAAASRTGSDMPSFEIPVRRAAAAGPVGAR
jgi:hypothetical protein